MWKRIKKGNSKDKKSKKKVQSQNTSRMDSPEQSPGRGGGSTSAGHSEDDSSTFVDALDEIVDSPDRSVGGRATGRNPSSRVGGQSNKQGDGPADKAHATPAPRLVPATPQSAGSDTPAPAGPENKLPQPRQLDPELAGSEDHNYNYFSTSCASEQNANEDQQQPATYGPNNSSKSAAAAASPAAAANGVDGSNDINIDDLLTQLDHVELDYETKLAKANDALHEKDTVISALGRQLTEMRDLQSNLQERLESSQHNVRSLREELDLANGAAAEVRAEMERMAENHDTMLVREVTRAEDAVRAEAERQFADANALYLKLGGERDSLVEERDGLRNDLVDVRKKMANEDRRARAREVETMAEVAKLRVDLAAAQAEVVAATKRHEVLAGDAREQITDLETRLETSRVDCAAAHHSLASVVSEKERLQKENTELSAMCEELMGLMEGNGGSSGSSKAASK